MLIMIIFLILSVVFVIGTVIYLNQKKKKVKDTFDDKLELGKFHSVFSEKIRL